MAKNKPRALTLPRFRLSIPQKWHKPLMIIFACILIIVFLISLMPERGTTDCKTDEVCFLQKAMRCEPAKFENMIGTTELKYVTAKDCTLTKTIVKLGEKEPNEVKSLFLGLSMKCKYPKGIFDRDFIDKINGNMDACEGPLKTVILDLKGS